MKKININPNDLTPTKKSEEAKKDNDKKESNALTAEKKREKDLQEYNTMSRHVFHSNNKNSNDLDPNAPSNRKKNYQFFCSVVTKAKESTPITNVNFNMNKKLTTSQPIYKKITSPVKNTQVQNTRSNFTKITNVSNVTNVVQPKSQAQILQNKRNAPQIQISIQNKYQQTKIEPKKIEIKKYEQKKIEPKKIEIKKYEPSTQSKIITNIVHTRAENQKQFQLNPQPKETQVHSITKNKYERKFDPSKPLNKTTITNSSYTNSNNNSNISINKNRQIYGIRTTSSIQNKDAPKLKYYARCPNCGYHLNDESAMNILYRNNTSDKISYLDNRKANAGNYENKSYYRGDKKDINIKSPAKNYNASNYWRQANYNQKTSIQNSARNLNKVKNFILPSNNMIFESTGNSKKSNQKK